MFLIDRFNQRNCLFKHIIHISSSNSMKALNPELNYCNQLSSVELRVLHHWWGGEELVCDWTIIQDGGWKTAI